MQDRDGGIGEGGAPLVGPDSHRRAAWWVSSYRYVAQLPLTDPMASTSAIRWSFSTTVSRSPMVPLTSRFSMAASRSPAGDALQLRKSVRIGAQLRNLGVREVDVTVRLSGQEGVDVAEVPQPQTRCGSLAAIRWCPPPRRSGRCGRPALRSWPARRARRSTRAAATASDRSRWPPGSPGLRTTRWCGGRRDTRPADRRRSSARPSPRPRRPRWSTASRSLPPHPRRCPPVRWWRPGCRRADLPAGATRGPRRAGPGRVGSPPMYDHDGGRDEDRNGGE